MKLGNKMLVAAMVAGLFTGLLALEKVSQTLLAQLVTQDAQCAVGSCGTAVDGTTQCKLEWDVCLELVQDHPGYPVPCGLPLNTPCSPEGFEASDYDEMDENQTFSGDGACSGTYKIYSHSELTRAHDDVLNDDGENSHVCPGSPLMADGSC